jgi:hypothetical protein
MQNKIKTLIAIFILMLVIGYFSNREYNDARSLLPARSNNSVQSSDPYAGTTRSHQFQNEYEEAKRNAPSSPLPLGLILPSGETVAERFGLNE